MFKVGKLIRLKLSVSAFFSACTLKSSCLNAKIIFGSENPEHLVPLIGSWDQFAELNTQFRESVSGTAS